MSEKITERQLAWAEIVLSVLITALIIWEIILGYRSMAEANRQIEILHQTLSVVTSQAKNLESMAKTLAAMDGALERQLAVLNAEQTQRLEEKEIKPRIALIVGGVWMHGQREQRLTFEKLGHTRAQFRLELWNQSLLQPESLILKAFIDDPNVVFECGLLGGPSKRRRVGEGTEFSSAIEPVGDTGGLATLTYPAETRQFHIEFSLSAKNMPEIRAGSITVEPPSRELP